MPPLGGPPAESEIPPGIVCEQAIADASAAAVGAADALSTVPESNVLGVAGAPAAIDAPEVADGTAVATAVTMSTVPEISVPGVVGTPAATVSRELADEAAVGAAIVALTLPEISVPAVAGTAAATSSGDGGVAGAPSAVPGKPIFDGVRSAVLGVRSFERARSGQSKCHCCNRYIPKGALRFEYRFSAKKPPRWVDSDCLPIVPDLALSEIEALLSRCDNDEDAAKLLRSLADKL